VVEKEEEEEEREFEERVCVKVWTGESSGSPVARLADCRRRERDTE